MTALKIAALLLLSAMAATPAGADSVVVTLAGDTGLNADRTRPLAEGGVKHGALVDWATVAAAAASLLAGDVALVNLETVVTDRDDLAPSDKRFVFAMHPEGLRALVQAGVDGFALANNHALDYGTGGAGETLRHLAASGAAAYPGLGRTAAEAAAPHLLKAGRAGIAFGSIGIGGSGFPDGGAGAGKLAFGDPDARAAATGALKQAAADIRILAFHHGDEYDVFADAAMQDDAADAMTGGADIVMGHHQHVAGPVALGPHGRVALFGLGNFMHFGTADLSGNGVCRDFGLVVRVRMTNLWGRWRATEIEAVPIAGTHRVPRRLAPDAARLRLGALNIVSARLTDPRLQAVTFGMDADGTGRACLERAGPACHAQPLALSADIAVSLARDCDRAPAQARLADR